MWLNTQWSKSFHFLIKSNLHFFPDCAFGIKNNVLDPISQRYSSVVFPELMFIYILYLSL